MASTSDWMDFDPPTAAERQVEAAYFAQLDAAESYAAYIEQMAADDGWFDGEPDDDGDEPFHGDTSGNTKETPEMATTMIRRQQTATPARWRKALVRAIAEGVQVRQLAGSGAWIATSGQDAGVAYQVAVSGGVAHGCDCPAGEHGDPVCKHRALWYHVAGLLDPEPEPPAPASIAVASRPCGACDGDGYQRIITGGHLSDWWAAPCAACQSTGTVPGEEAPALAA